ncbi:hypothetical protein [Streptomyces hydrogenans]|uniref:hypothetical protein n=1 Tax=Streptomyces hydrogenans TaxID=1873719 RepID=UPI003427BBF7
MKNRVVATLAAMASIFGFALVSAPAASAGGYGCSGGLIDIYAIKNSTGHLGTSTYASVDDSDHYSQYVAGVVAGGVHCG